MRKVGDLADLRKGARVTRPTRDRLAADIRKKYEKGASIRAIAEAVGRSYGFVHRTLTEAGVTLRGRSAKTSDSEPRAAAHRLLDEVPAERMPAVVALLRKEAGGTAPVPRRFRTVGVFSAEPDLGERSKDIARKELGGKPSKSA